MTSNLTLVFVQGAWYPVDSWNKLTSLLEAQQYKCVCVPSPSAQSNPDATFYDDVLAVRKAIEEETTQGRDVVLVVHSYGSLPGSSAAKGLTLPKGGLSVTAGSTSGHVLGFVMLATGFPVSGLSFLNHTGGRPPPFWKIDTESGFAVLTADVRELFFHDLPEEEGKYWASNLGGQSLKSLMEGGEHTYAAWMDTPCWYLATTEDRGLPVEAQRMFVQMAKEAGGDVAIREIRSGHSPMLSKPQETADFTMEAVEYFKSQRA
ncbi:hypothetical protein DL769_004725 [Monosporascus sp. CRB-8-3]|nr:hypothetical protein DL769_004725 [Monosporascus sp. CRB-8-3]